MIFSLSNLTELYITDEGATKCDPMDPQTSTANWSFNANQTKVTIDGDEGDIA
jgi:hypothetical protein